MTGGRDRAADGEGPAHGRRSRGRGRVRAEQTCHADNRINDEVAVRREQEDGVGGQARCGADDLMQGVVFLSGRHS